MKNSLNIFLIVCLGIFTSSTVYAQTKIDATVYLVITEEESIKVSDKTIGTRVELTGVLQTTDSSSPFHLASVNCRGTAIFKSILKEAASCLVCDVVDSDGDAFLVERKGGKEIKILGGAGKYEGMSGEGSVRVVKELGEDKIVEEWGISVGG